MKMEWKGVMPAMTTAFTTLPRDRSRLCRPPRAMDGRQRLSRDCHSRLAR
jgi:hypothetical protein